METGPPGDGPEGEDWIARLLQQGPYELQLDALDTDLLNILPPGHSQTDTEEKSSDESSQSQLMPPGRAAAAAVNDLDLPELEDLLQDPFWQDLAVQSEASCPSDATCQPGCSCDLPAHAGRRQGKRVARKQPRPADQLLSSWTNVSPASSDSGTPPKHQPEQRQQQAQHSTEYPSSSQDSSHRPPSPAEALRDTSGTAPTPQQPVSPPQPEPVPQSHPHFQPSAPAPTIPFASAPAPGFQFIEGRRQAAEGTSTDQSEMDPEEAKKAARMQRNRESAHHSRQRKKMQTSDLERRCQELQSHNTHLTGLVNQLTTEVGMLRHQLVMASTQGGAQPMHATPGNFAYAPFAVPMGLLPSQQAATPKVPIQKLPPSRPAPAKKVKAFEQGQQQHAGSAGARPNKRAKTVAAVSAGATAMMALCCVLVISGGPGLPPSHQGSGGQLGQAVLPTTRGPGRALQSFLPALTNDTETAAALGLLQGALQDVNGTEWNGDVPPRWQAGNGSSAALEPVTLRPLDKGAEALALQHLKDLAPVAVISDWAQQSQARSLASTPQFHSFPQLAGSVLGSAGLPSPASCREVFSFDATSLVDIGAAQAALKRHLANLGTLRGRNLGALPLPPIGGSLPASSQEEEVVSKRPKQMIGCGDDSEVVVSLMLPTRQASDEEAPSLNSLDQIFVVVLKPGKQYTTYSCGLDKPVFA